MTTRTRTTALAGAFLCILGGSLTGCTGTAQHAMAPVDGVMLPPRAGAPDPYPDPTNAPMALSLMSGDRLGLQLAAHYQARERALEIVNGATMVTVVEDGAD